MNQTCSSATLIFDFDGTIADTMELVWHIFNRIAPEYRCIPVTPEECVQFRDQRPIEAMKRHGVTITKLPRLIMRIRREIGKSIVNVPPICGIIDTIRQLDVNGYEMGIVTSNAVENVHAFLQENGLLDHFRFIWNGNNLFGKDRVLKKLIRKKGFSKDSVLYIGDEIRDIEAVRKTGIPIIAVTWGYNTRSVLEPLHPDRIADTPGELYECIRSIFAPGYNM